MALVHRRVVALAPTFATSKASGHPHSAEAAYTYLCRFVNAHYVYTLVGTLRRSQSPRPIGAQDDPTSLPPRVP